MTLKQFDILDTLEDQDTSDKIQALNWVKSIFGSTASETDFNIAFTYFSK